MAKNYFFSKCLLAAFAAVTPVVPALADPIDEAQARQIAASFCETGTQATLVKRASRSTSKVRRLPASAQSTSPYYIYSRGEGQGFVIVSGDDCLPQVLGYTESGDWDEDTAAPQLLGWLQAYADLVEDAQESGQSVSRNSPARRASTTSSKADIDVLLTSHWHQSWPYNNMCPYITGTTNRAVTGCVATAASQVGYYFRKDMPDELQNSTPTYGYGDAPVTTSVAKGTPLKWGLMLDDYNSTHPSEYDDVVAEYVFAVGAASWMTYGSSSGAQTDAVVNTYSSYFDMSSSGAWKSGYSQTAWENLVYRNLQEGRPMVYSGYTTDNSGHCIVLDGYRSSGNLFHFNFGWGGQSDGWYTVDDETGVNGFGTNQYMVYDITPRHQNLSAKMKLEDNALYTYHDNAVTVTVSNNGTLDYSGLYLFLNTSSKAPTALSSAKAEDTETVIPADGSEQELTFAVRPVASRTLYLILTDKNLNVLAQQEVEATPCENDLRLCEIRALGSPCILTANDGDYTMVNGKRAYVVATVENLSDCSYEDTPRLDLYGSTDGGETFSFVGTKYADRTVIAAGETGDIKFDLTSTSSCPIDTSICYHAVLKDPLTSHSDTHVTYAEGQDSVARFYLYPVDDELAASLHGDTLTFSGYWNAGAFLSICGRSSNAKATIYDLTAVKEVGYVPQGVGNALAYVAGETTEGGVNVVNVKTASAEKIKLTMGNDFHPLMPFTAGEAEITLQATPNSWFLFTAPFTTSLPDGLVAKEIQSHSATGINNRTELVRTLQAGKTYILMASSSRALKLTAHNADVAAAPVQNVDTALIGTFATTTAPAGAFSINDEESQYFAASSEAFSVAPFSGWLYDTKITKDFRANSQITLDPVYKSLGEAIASAYETLDRYASVTTAEAYALLADSLAEAEACFGLRTLETTSEVRDYTERLLALAEEYKTQLARGIDEEMDLTYLIENPSFEESASSTATQGSTMGWTLGGSGVRVLLASNVTYRAVGGDKDNFLYSCTSDSMGNGISQTISDILPGLYRLTAKVGCAEGNSVTLYANQRTATTAAHPYGIYYLTEVAVDSVVVPTDSTLTIGIQSGSWYKADDFRLTYLRSLTPEEAPVAIERVNLDADAVSRRPDAIYDLTGRRLQAAPAHGLYIEVRNGVARKLFRR